MEQRASGRPDDTGDDRDGVRHHRDGVRHHSDDDIDEASAESFPASDAPQWWSGEPDDEP